MMRTDNRISVLRIDLGDSFDFFRIFLFFAFGCRYHRRYRLLLKFIYLCMGIINFENEILDLLLKKFNDRVALGDYRITLIDLVFPMMNSLISSSDDPIFLGHQGSKLVNLGDLSISLPIVTSRSINQLTHFAM
jgi:hypothetical protein